MKQFYTLIWEKLRHHSTSKCRLKRMAFEICHSIASLQNNEIMDRGSLSEAQQWQGHNLSRREETIRSVCAWKFIWPTSYAKRLWRTVATEISSKSLLSAKLTISTVPYLRDHFNVRLDFRLAKWIAINEVIKISKQLSYVMCFALSFFALLASPWITACQWKLLHEYI